MSKHYIATFHNDHHEFIDEAVTGKPEIIEYVANDEVYRIGDEYLYSFEDFKDCKEINYKIETMVRRQVNLIKEGTYFWAKVDFRDEVWEPVKVEILPNRSYNFLRCGIASVYSFWRIEVCGQDIMVEDTKSK